MTQLIIFLFALLGENNLKDHTVKLHALTIFLCVSNTIAVATDNYFLQPGQVIKANKQSRFTHYALKT